MKHTRLPQKRLIPVRLVSLFTAASATVAQAQNVNSTLAESGGNAFWGANATWDTNVVPNSQDAVVNISGNVTSNLAFNLQGSSYTLGDLTYKDNASTFRDLSLGNGTLTVSTSSGTATWTNNTTSGSAQVLINILANSTIAAASGQTLILTNTNGPGTISATDSTGPAIRFNSSTSWNSFSGNLTFGKGLFQANAANSLPQSIALTLGHASDAAYLRLVGGQTQAIAALNGNSQSFIFNNSASTAAGLTFNSTLSGNFAGSIGTNGNVSFSNAGINISKLGNGTQTLSGSVRGNGTMSVSGGTLVLSGDNSYTGNTTINSGGTLKLGHANALGSTATGNTTLSSGGTLDLNGTSTAEFITIAGGNLTNSSGSAGALTANASITGAFTVNNSGDITTARLIATSLRTITKTGLGNLTTSGTNHNNLIAWDIQQGTVVLANTAGLGADRGVTLNGGTLKLSGSNSNLVNDTQAFTINSGTFDLNGKGEAVASIGGSGGIITNTNNASATLYVGGGVSGSSNATYGGTIQNGVGVLALTKEGTGTQTLSGNNTYTGATTVSNGTLEITGSLLSSSIVLNGGTFKLGTSGSIASSSTITINGGSFDSTALVGGYTVASGQTLKGNGTYSGKIIVGTGATLAPGNSPGVVTFDNDLTLAGNTAIEINGSVRGTDYDGVNLTGSGANTLTYGGALSLSFGAAIAAGTYDLFALGSVNQTGDFTSVGATGAGIVSSFSGLVITTGTGWTASLTDTLAQNWTLTFDNASGDLTIATAIPEPSAYAVFVGFGALGLAAVWRRRRSC